MDSLIIGFHAHKGKHNLYSDAVREMCDIVREWAPCVRPAAAIFASGPRSTRVISQREIESLSRGTTSREFDILAHAGYMDLPWGSSNFAAARAVPLLNAITTIGALGVVVHPGPQFFSHRRAHEVFAELRDATRQYPETPMFIETMSSPAQFSDPRALAAIFDIARDEGTRVGVCIDTAHVWGAGANLRTRESCAAWLDELGNNIPFAMHLNDSSRARGSLSDVHEPLGAGKIWADDDGYIAAIEWANEHGAPVIMERTHDVIAAAQSDMKLLADVLCL